MAPSLTIQGVCSSYPQHSRERLPKGPASTKGPFINRDQLIFPDLPIGSNPTRSRNDHNAMEQQWPGSGRNVLVGEMVQKGAWYVEKAPDGVEEMLQTAN